MPSTMFMIPSIACCKLPSPSFWIVKRCTLSRRDNASLAWTGSILLFVNFQEISFSFEWQHLSVCVKGKRIKRGVGYGLEISAEYIFYVNEKAIQWANQTSDGVDGNVKKKVLRCLKKSHFEKNHLFPTCVLFFLACPLLGGNFHRDNPSRTWNFCPLMRGARYLEVFL